MVPFLQLFMNPSSLVNGWVYMEIHVSTGLEWISKNHKFYDYLPTHEFSLKFSAKKANDDRIFLCASVSQSFLFLRGLMRKVASQLLMMKFQLWLLISCCLVKFCILFFCKILFLGLKNNITISDIGPRRTRMLNICVIMSNFITQSPFINFLYSGPRQLFSTKLNSYILSLMVQHRAPCPASWSEALLCFQN